MFQEGNAQDAQLFADSPLFTAMNQYVGKKVSVIGEKLLLAGKFVAIQYVGLDIPVFLIERYPGLVVSVPMDIIQSIDLTDEDVEKQSNHKDEAEKTLDASKNGDTLRTNDEMYPLKSKDRNFTIENFLYDAFFKYGYSSEVFISKAVEWITCFIQNKIHSNISLIINGEGVFSDIGLDICLNLKSLQSSDSKYSFNIYFLNNSKYCISPARHRFHLRSLSMNNFIASDYQRLNNTLVICGNLIGLLPEILQRSYGKVLFILPANLNLSEEEMNICSSLQATTKVYFSYGFSRNSTITSSRLYQIDMDFPNELFEEYGISRTTKHKPFAKIQ